MNTRWSHRIAVALVLCASFVTSALAHDYSSNRYPPNRPSAGFVFYYEPQAVRLVYNTGLGVYLVEGHPHCYYHRGRFYRVDNGVWVSTTNFKAGKWKKAKRNSLPPGLAKKMG